MIPIPAIDLREGRVVRLTQGDYNQQRSYDVDAVALADGILELLRDPGLRAGLAERGRAQLLAHHTEAQIIGQYLELYKKLAGGG